MDWSPQQQDAIGRVQAWLTDSTAPQVFRLFGYAGTGKTTLARYLAQGVGATKFAAFTGKAALVLKRSGCPDPSTIHKLIYRPKEKSAARYDSLQQDLQVVEDEINLTQDEEKVNELAQRAQMLREEIAKERQNLERPSFTLNLDSDVRFCRLVVIDEVSMVGEEMAEDLLSFETPVLVLGDPAQLPPVGGTGYFINAKPDVMLTEIHRQAEASPIIDMATRIRKGQGLDIGDYGDGCRVVRKGDLKIGDLAGFDQVLVGRNHTRNVINRRLREYLIQAGQVQPLPGEHRHLPSPGDRLVCLRNNHDLGLLNGSIWRVLDSTPVNEDEIGLSLYDEDTDSQVETIAHRHYFEDRQLDWWERRSRDEFDYGYALTVHKAQGSQWDSVVVVDEGGCFRDKARNWRYTAVTRAAETITVIRK